MTTFGDQVFMRGGIPLGGDLFGLIGDGNVYYVDPGKGDDANAGDRPDRAKATLSAAVALCTSEQGDVIVRLPGTETVTAELENTTEGILVVAATSAYSGGAGRGAGAEYYLMWGPALTDAPVLTIRQGMSIRGLSFGNAWTTSSANYNTNGHAVAIRNEVSGDQGGFTIITDCEFPSWGTNDVGLQLAGAAHVFVYRNSFGGASGTLPVGIGLYGTSTSNCINNVIEDNLFTNVTTGIFFKSATPQETYIIGNTFSGTQTDAISWAGVTLSSTIDGIVARNNFGTAVDGASFAGGSGGSGSEAGQIESDSGFAFSNNGYAGTE